MNMEGMPKGLNRIFIKKMSDEFSVSHAVSFFNKMEEMKSCLDSATSESNHIHDESLITAMDIDDEYASRNVPISAHFSSMVDHFSLAMKMNRIMGMSFGLKPYSKVGYEFSENIYTGVDSLRYTYRGRGSLQDFYLALTIFSFSTKMKIAGISLFVKIRTCAKYAQGQ